MSKLLPVIEVGKEEDAGSKKKSTVADIRRNYQISSLCSPSPRPRVPASVRPRITASLCLRIYRLATRINKNIPIPKKTKLGNQAPIKGDKTPACAIAPLIKKIK